MSQADYYLNGNNSTCDTIHYPLSTLHYQLSTPNYSHALSGAKSKKQKFH
ncbi:MAG: hypothetical protein LBE12_19180 [Planctomycetaceae bacterium]|nr:hypothetical protein [Planctomycetaceae bacterium]